MTIFTSKYPSAAVPETDLPSFLLNVARASDAHKLNPNNKLFIDAASGKGHSLADVEALSRRFASGLVKKLSFREKDVLMVATANTIDYAVFVLGTLMAGGVVSPANPEYTVGEMAYQLSSCGARFVLAAASRINVVLEAAKQVGIPLSQIIVYQDDDAKKITASGTVSYETIIDTKDLIEPVVLDGEEAKSRVALLCSSSGTSGKPKIVMTSHYNTVSSLVQMAIVAMANPPPVSASPTASPPQQHRSITVIPTYHMYGLMVLVFATILSGSQTVVLPRFNLEVFLATIEKYRVTTLPIVPPILLAMTKSPLTKKYDLSSIAAAGCGAAKMSDRLRDSFEDKYSSRVANGYGMTETTPGIARTPNGPRPEGSVGTLIPLMEAKIVSEDGKQGLGVGETGEIHVRGPNIMLGYYGNPAATAECLAADGWFATGDVGHFDKDGFLYLTDRKKSLIKYKGYQVSPAELEGIITSHPAVADCAVIGIDLPEQATEVPKAFVVLQPGQAPSAQLANGIIEFALKRSAPHKKLRGGVEFTDAIPKSAAGKILHRILRDQEIAKSKAIKSKL